MEFPQSEKEIFDYVNQKNESLLSLHKEMNQDYIVHIYNNVSQRRLLFQNFATLSAVILGFTPFFFNSDKIRQIHFLFASIISLLLVIILVINYLRSQIDVEGNELKRQVDDYNAILRPQREKTNKYILKADFSQEAFHDYLRDVSKESKDVIDKMKAKEDERRLNTSKQVMDYAGEFFVLLFSLGIIFLIVSFTNIKFSASEWFIFSLIVFVFTFFVPYHKLFIYLGYPIDYVKNFFEQE